MRGDITLDILLAKTQDCVAGATKLERTGTLKIFALAEQSAAQRFIEARVIQNGRVSGLVTDSGPCQVNVSNIG
jgi:hypothetical protein